MIHKIRHRLPFSLRGFPTRDNAYLVGGSVRDVLLGRQASDFDLVIDGSAPRFAEELTRRLEGHLVVLGHADQRIWRVAAQDQCWDIASLQGPDIHADLVQRDFTINAVAIELATGHVIDPTGGMLDLDSGVIRMVSEQVFRRDPLRLLRAYRLSATLTFALDENTQAAIRRDSKRLLASAGERVRTELLKMLTVRALPQIRQMHRHGLLQVILPELKPLEDCQQNAPHATDALTHTLDAFGALERMIVGYAGGLNQPCRKLVQRWSASQPALLKLAVLLHDIGKPAVRTVGTDGRIHFYGHARHGAKLSLRVSRRLKLSSLETDYLEHIIKSHLRPLHLFMAQQRAPLSRKARVRFFKTCGPYLNDLMLHAIADQWGKSVAAQPEAFIAFVYDVMHQYETAYLPLKRSPALVRGQDLIQIFNLSPSPLVGQILRQVEEERLAGRLTSRQEALNRIRALLSTRAKNGDA